MKYFLLAAAFVLTGCASRETITDESIYVHAYSGVELKPQMGLFTLQDMKSYDTEGKNISFNCLSNVDYSLLLALYIYPLYEATGDTIAPAASSYTELLKKHFAECKEQIRKADEENPSIKARLKNEETSRINNIDFIIAIYDCNYYGEDHESLLYLGRYNNSFLKFRATFDKKHNFEVYSMVKNFIKEINSPE